MFNKLAAAANINPADWNVHLFDDPEMVDVRAIRGNYVFVWSGVFDVVQARDEIAGLLACEIAHGLARHNQPVEFSMATEMLFGMTDMAASIGLLVLSQGAVAVSGTGMSRWLYVEAADLDDLDRVVAAVDLPVQAVGGLSIEQALETGWKDWGHWLRNDRALAVQTEATVPPAPYDIPMQASIGNELHLFFFACHGKTTRGMQIVFVSTSKHFFSSSTFSTFSLQV